MMGNLYQLKTNAPQGAHVTFKGPYDRFGIVMKHQASGFHLIRGLGMGPPAGVRIIYAAEAA